MWRTHKHRRIDVDMWMHTHAWAHMHTFKHDDSDRSCITKGCSNRPQYFMNILLLSVLSSIFYFILACSAFFLWKKVSFLSISSQRIAGVRWYRQQSERRGKRKWSERGKKYALRGLEKAGIDGSWAAKVRQQQISDFRDKPHFSPWATFLPVLHTFSYCCCAFLAL